MQNSILIITNTDDRSIEPVLHHLQLMSTSFFRFDSNLFPITTQCTMLLGKEKILTKFFCDEVIINLDKVKSVWYRRPIIGKSSPCLKGEDQLFAEKEIETCLWSLYTTLDAFWINPPLIGHRLLEHNKMYQMKRAQEIGLSIPETIITNNYQDILDFCDTHQGTIAIKTLRGHFFSTHEEKCTTDAFVIYTNKITRDILVRHKNDIALAPIMAQEYVQKKLELRITIIGKKIFTCAIHSQKSERTKNDWRRYDLKNTPHEIFQLPIDIEIKLLSFMEKLNLSFGAIDMILTPDDEYVFLEINPQGQWGWIESLTGMPISKTIAEFLNNPPI